MTRLVLSGVALLALAGALQLLTFALGDPVAEGIVEANRRFEAGDFAGALARYRDLQRQRPDLAELAVNSGNALYRMDEHARAAGEYERALATAQGAARVSALYGRGNALFRLNRLDDARASYVDALRLDPALRDAKFNIEVIDRKQEEARLRREAQQRQQQQQGQNQPGASPRPGDQRSGQQPGQQPRSSASPGPGASGAPDASPTPSVGDALIDFRRALGVEEALRLLDALRGQQRGIEIFIEVPAGSRSPDPRY